MSEDLFISELKKINININEKQINELNKYYELLIEWNEKKNLTIIVEKSDVYLKHFYDSLTLQKSIDLNNDYSLCDIGSGAGFPGIVLKILFPKLKIVLVDSLNKRVNFLNLVIKELGLSDITALHFRIEDYGKINREKFDIVTSRAVTRLPILLEFAVPLVKVNGYFIPLKGSVEEECLDAINAIKVLNVKEIQKIEFKLPVENSTRTIIKYQKLKSTNKKYPRSFKEISNSSL